MIIADWGAFFTQTSISTIRHFRSSCTAPDQLSPVIVNVKTMDSLVSEPQLSDCEIDRMLAEAEVRLATTSKDGPNPCQISSSRTLVHLSKPSTNSCRQPELRNDHQDLTLRQPKLASSQAPKVRPGVHG